MSPSSWVEMEREMGRQLGAVSAVIQSWSYAEKRQPRQKAELLI